MSLKIKTFTFNAFQVNTYLLTAGNGECIIIDPACYSPAELDTLKNHISEAGLKPVLCLQTHCHVDHVLGLNFARDTFGISAAAHEGDASLLEQAHIMGMAFGFKAEPVRPIEQVLQDGEVLNLDGNVIRALHVPGHSPGSLAFFAENSGIVITGDALFAGSIGRTDLPGGDYDTLVQSIQDKLFVLPGDTSVYPGHGTSTTIEKEKRDNPFF